VPRAREHRGLASLAVPGTRNQCFEYRNVKTKKHPQNMLFLAVAGTGKNYPIVNAPSMITPVIVLGGVSGHRKGVSEKKVRSYRRFARF
jgi:hypothetical protein